MESARRETPKIMGIKGAGKWVLALVAVLSSISSWAAGSDAGKALFEEGNKLYEQRKYSEAVSSYEKAIQNGQSNGPVFFNLGNAFYKAGQPGKSIAAYREAEKTIPRDPGLRYNLQFVRNQVSGGGASVQKGWKRWLAHLTLNEWTVLFMCAFWVWMGLLALGEVRPELRKTMRGYTGVAGLVMALLGAALGSSAYELTSEREAVVVVTNAVVRFGPLEEASVAFQLRDGSEVAVTGEKDVADGTNRQGWYQIEDAGRRSGWLKADQVDLVR
jgi:tetratricopeptide (TPR) repeat protein